MQTVCTDRRSMSSPLFGGPQVVYPRESCPITVDRRIATPMQLGQRSH